MSQWSKVSSFVVSESWGHNHFWSTWRLGRIDVSQIQFRLFLKNSPGKFYEDRTFLVKIGSATSIRPINHWIIYAKYCYWNTQTNYYNIFPFHTVHSGFLFRSGCDDFLLLSTMMKKCSNDWKMKPRRLFQCIEKEKQKRTTARQFATMLSDLPLPR